MGYGPNGKPTSVSIERYEKLRNEFNELLAEHKNLVEALEAHKTVMEMENANIITYITRCFIIFNIITRAKDNLNKFIKA